MKEFYLIENFCNQGSYVLYISNFDILQIFDSIEIHKTFENF